jgi:hypothetical protein
MSLKDTESRIVVRRGRPRDLPDELMPHRDAARVEEVDDADHLRVRQRGELLFGVQAELRQRRQDGEPNLDAERAPHAYGHLSSGPLDQHLMVHHAARGELPLGGRSRAPLAAARCGTLPGGAAQYRARSGPARARGRPRLPRSGAPAAPQPKLAAIAPSRLPAHNQVPSTLRGSRVATFFLQARHVVSRSACGLFKGRGSCWLASMTPASAGTPATTAAPM